MGPREHALLEVVARVGLLRRARVVRDHHDRLLEVPVERLQEVEDLEGALRVEVAGGLVGDQHLGVGHDGPRDRHPLLLAAGELPRVVGSAVGEAHDLERGQRPLPPLGLREMGEQERQLHVLGGGEHRDEVVELEDEAHVVAAEAGELGLAEPGHVGAGHHHVAGGRLVDAGDQVQQRRLARSRGAHQGGVVALRDLQAQAVEHDQLLGVPAVDLRDVANVDHCHV